MKRFFACLTAALAISGLYPSLSMAQAPATTTAPATQPTRSKIGFVNIARVLREYQRADEKGQEIATRRKAYLEQVTRIRNQMAEANRKLGPSTNPAEKDAMQKQIVDLTRQIEDIDRTAQKELTDLSNSTIVQVHSDITMVIKAVAQNYSLEMVLCYPDASTKEEEKSPTVAQLKLQTPALMPFYFSPSMDYTEVVVRTLNSNFPAKTPKVTPVSGTTPAPTTPEMK